MLSKIQKPKTKQELIKALQSAPIKSFEIYEGSEVSLMPQKNELTRQGATIIVLR
ncbi:hypothetical protein [Novosphingobium sp.]|jgi:hypothetical protein|uniref:hypothetical protein n=1 Tax=Novosphingobium sp. TaxID=1874826 RepID=UPI0022CCAD74|nr:hypothetical protein [Novosphingobium sp.]MCZ8018672.1 hypothetical protein [Novosphingobium sp.]MCZ8034677.1 hypothetical protein [Novosphingobium sp.]MCZ8052812.1 hypothetical protein [Novosphingobium sp.]MCZ8060570.1 hypothetical protein [Novosphingobium sp.]MCZ8230596.1 hypothetical protein [Novosphingobium sp.]